MSDLAQDQRQARTDLAGALRGELLGPAGGEDEELPSRERPTLRYLIGRLAPARTAVSAEEDEGAGEAATDDDDTDSGYASPITMAMNPSSIGLSFLTEPGVEQLELTLRWARYEPDEREETGEDGRTRRHKVYRRQQAHHVVVLQLPVAPPGVELEPGIRAEFLVRELDDGRAAVSVFLVNRIEARIPERPEDDEWLFQPEISARATDHRPAFSARRLEDIAWTDDPDLLASELLYWNRPEYATGHGCAADWTAPDGHREGATEVRTEIFPAYEIARIDPREDNDRGLDMRILGGPGPGAVPGEQLRELLTPLADQYLAWIDQRLRGEMLPDVPPKLQEQALDHIDACERACARVRAGIELVATDHATREAFCFANRAMALQRERSVKSLARRRGELQPTSVTARWRPFQLAFILLNLPALADRNHRDRDVADLLWFPTGGGKTEAYLGLTAFTLAHRRMRRPVTGHRDDAGVTVLMRYTLRLLTVQQFQRAATLICACEYLRASEGVLGGERFSLGLWVGQSATPNSYDDQQGDRGAKQALQRLARDQLPRRGGGSPVQLLYCPWCGAPLTHKERGASAEKPITGTYMADDDTARVEIYCPDQACDFSSGISEGIPAHTVDEQVYRNVPSLVIATVDKFAQMPFNGRTQALFGRVDRHCPRHGYLTTAEKHPGSHRATRSAPGEVVASVQPFEPPDLIIQDELHLISGPLGTLVGLYETAVDILSSVALEGRRVGPKVIASTATIRRSEQQIGALFRRRAAVFPPSGLESTDSWFGREVPCDVAPGRLYLGVCAPGKSVKTALVRVYAALLSRAKALHDASTPAGDPYMTLVGYFNSLRELGGALRLIEDDVPGRIRVLHRRDGATWPLRTLFEREELTSNKQSEEIPKIIDKLERRFTSEPPRAGAYPIDTILASNMISVGVDIDRLGLMVVNGQPKTTAEYIQATSRIGRQPPGLVVTVYNWTRPRDISHYERFRAYHGCLYRNVEATSVTPFSPRARDKGLEGVLTSVVRLGDGDLAGEQDAGKFDRSDPRVAEMVELIAHRAGAVSDSADAAAETREEVLADLDKWTSVAVPDMLSYSWRGLGGQKGREAKPDRRYLLDSQESRVKEGSFQAPGSLREVESEVHVYLLDTELAATGAAGDD
ncbi:MAG TPA: DISARM system helicase DrmA [Streptosporangiaceae bacterium]|nr:DISARM system helicase DrmA [Streptosporangiaceae bacterium]